MTDQKDMTSNGDMLRRKEMPVEIWAGIHGMHGPTYSDSPVAGWARYTRTDTLNRQADTPAPVRPKEVEDFMSGLPAIFDREPVVRSYLAALEAATPAPVEQIGIDRDSIRMLVNMLHERECPYCNDTGWTNYRDQTRCIRCDWLADFEEQLAATPAPVEPPVDQDAARELAIEAYRFTELVGSDTPALKNAILKIMTLDELQSALARLEGE